MNNKRVLNSYGRKEKLRDQTENTEEKETKGMVTRCRGGEGVTIVPTLL
jgi:hypothetical protein